MADAAWLCPSIDCPFFPQPQSTRPPRVLRTWPGTLRALIDSPTNSPAFIVHTDAGDKDAWLGELPVRFGSLRDTLEADE